MTVLDDAIEEVACAERALVTLLAELKVMPRADKTAVSPMIETALSRLRKARTLLATTQTPDV